MSTLPIFFYYNVILTLSLDCSISFIRHLFDTLRVKIGLRGHGVTTRGIFGVAAVFYCLHAMPEPKAATKVGEIGNARVICQRTHSVVYPKSTARCDPRSGIIVHTPQPRLGAMTDRCIDCNICNICNILIYGYVTM